MSVDQIILLSQSVAKAHERVEKMKQELQYILDFTGVGYCSISLSSKQRTVSIDFGQLMEMYEDSLLPALQYVAEQRVKQAEKDLEETAAKLRAACTQSVRKTEDKPWYPDLPGWTWHEYVCTDDIPLNLDHSARVQVLFDSERDGKKFKSEAVSASNWSWGPHIVAYATEND